MNSRKLKFKFQLNNGEPCSEINLENLIHNSERRFGFN